MRGCDFGAKCTRNCLAAGLCPYPLGVAHSAAPDSLAEFRGWEGRDGRGKRQGKERERGYVKGRREDGREEKDGGGKEESKGVGLCPTRN